MLTLAADLSGRVFFVEHDTGRVSEIGDAGIGLTDIDVAPDGRIYAVSFNSLFEIDGTTGAATRLFDLPGSIGANALEILADGSAYLAGFNSDQLYEVDLDSGGTVAVSTMGSTSAGDLQWYDGRLLLASGGGRLVEVSTDGTTGPVLRGTFNAGESIYGLAEADDGRLLALGDRGGIFSFDIETGETRFIVDTANRFAGSASTSAPDGNDPPPAFPEPPSLVTPTNGDDTLVYDDGKNRIRAGEGADRITDGGGKDKVFGEGGDDVFFVSAGRDKFDGGTGFDTAVFDGPSSTFKIKISGNGKIKVKDRDPRDGDLGKNKLKDVEILEFDDGTITVGANLGVKNPLLDAVPATSNASTLTALVQTDETVAG